MKISVIIPVYNKSKYLRTILQQLISQSFEDFECLLVDDGSNDGSEVICDEYALKDERIKVVHLVNGGVSHARNVALDRSCGEYVTFIDADDMIHDDYLKSLHECIINSGADIVISSLRKFWDDKEEQVVVSYPRTGWVLKKEDVLSDFAKVQQETGIFGFCACKLFARQLVHDIRFDENLRLAEDFDFYLKLYQRIKTYYFDDKAYYYYRQTAEGSTAIVEDPKVDYLSQLKINLRYRDFLQAEKAYSDENKRIVENKINNYIYFTMFHCPRECMRDRFVKLYDLCEGSGVTPVGNGIRQSVLLRLLRGKKIKSAEFLICCYRFLRNIKHGKKQ